MIALGLCTIELQIPGVRSLKEKRRVVRSLVTRVRNEYNVSVAEVGDLDKWQLATIAVSCVSSDARHVHRLLERIANGVESGRDGLVLLDYTIELL